MKLKWSLVELAKYRNQPLVLEGKAGLTNSLKKRKKDLLDATPITINGIVSSESNDRYLVDLTLDVTLTLPSSRSLTPVDFHLIVPMIELYLAPNLSQDLIDDDLDNKIVISLEKDILDLKKPIEDTILASIPMKILSEEEIESDELPRGEGWEVILEDEFASSSSEESGTAQSNPFDALKDLDLFHTEDEEQ